MKKIQQLILLMVFLFPAQGSLLQAEGLYSNKSQEDKSIGTTTLYQAETKPGTLRAGIDDDGEPKGDDQEGVPAGEGLLLLTALGGIWAGYKQRRSKK